MTIIYNRITEKGVLLPLLLALAVVPMAQAASSEFVHPGMLHSRAELEFVKAKIQAGDEPWKSAWLKLRASRYASLDWRPRREPDVVRDLAGGWRGARELGDDALAAYAHALQWSLTGERFHARNVAEILNARSRSLKSITGHDAKLLAGITGYKFCNAAELIRSTPSEWRAEDQAQFAVMLTNVNLGFDVPAVGKISAQGRGRFRPIYEKVYHHYHDRAGLEMKFTRRVIEKIRPEGEQWDHVSWGTLMFADLPAFQKGTP